MTVNHEIGVRTSTPTFNIYREMTRAALDELHAAQQRIASLEAQVKAAREEIRRYVAERMTE